MLEYKIGNRKVSESQFKRHLADAARDKVTEAAVDRIESVRCPRHGKRVRVVKTMRKGKNVNFEFSGCCDEAISKAQRVLRR